jgi:hypothetical protein
MSDAPTPPLIDGEIGKRLDEQIKYYDGKAIKCQKYYKRIKLAEIIAAALIPFFAAVHLPEAYQQYQGAMGPLTALLGVLITILEGVLQLGQYQQIWITYRATCEAMKHEQFNYIAKAGVYAEAKNPYALLAERIETIGSQENTKWASLAQLQPKGKGVDQAAPKADQH